MRRDNLGEFEHQVLLALLRCGPDAYSVPILIALEERTGREVASAAVYIALRRLEEKRLARSRMGPPESGGGRDRRYFSITPAGRRRLGEERAALLRLWEGMEPQLEEGS